MELLTILIYVCVFLTVIFIIAAIYAYFKLRNVESSTLDFTELTKEINSLTQLLKTFQLELEVKNILEK